MAAGWSDTSYIDDIRFNGDTVYITDAGAPGLIVLDPATGGARRLLDNHPSTVDSRPMYADGKVLRDPDGNEVRVHADQVEMWVDTPATGGTAIDANGVIYLSDTNRRRILTITPDRQIQPFIADPRLIWPDAMWIDNEGFLWIPTAQLNLTPGLNGGELAVNYPVWIYKMRIDAAPAPNDHP
jgi:sugar lactone lactonase YvrE